MVQELEIIKSISLEIVNVPGIFSKDIPSFEDIVILFYDDL